MIIRNVCVVASIISEADWKFGRFQCNSKCLRDFPLDVKEISIEPNKIHIQMNDAIILFHKWAIISEK